MKFSFATALTLATLSLSVGLGGCAADSAEVASEGSPKAVVVDTTEHALSVVASGSHPAVSDGRVVDAWQTSMTVEGAFRVRGVTSTGEAIAEFTFKPHLAGAESSVVIESVLPERGELRIENGAFVNGFELSANTLALYEAMGQDLEALAAQAEAPAGDLTTQGWWACTKASAKVTVICGSSAVNVVICLRKATKSLSAIAACIGKVEGSSCKSAAQTFAKECL
jgi:hypothetical protein